MSTTSLLSLIAIFAAIYLVIYGVMQYIAKSRAMKKRVRDALTHEEPVLAPKKASPLRERITGWLSSSGQWAMQKDAKEISKVQKSLIMAGYRHSLAPTILYGIRAVFAFLLPLPFIMFMVIKAKVTQPNLGLAFMLAGLGYFLPPIILDQIVKRRQNRIDRALPDVLDLFTICLEAGLGLQASINRVADEIRSMCEDFYIELQITAGEMRAGIVRDEAMRNLASRTGVQSVRALATLIIQSDKLGTSIAHALRVHADTSRTHRALKAEEKAGQMPVKIMIPMIFFIFPAIFVVAVGPGAIQIARNLLPRMAGR